MSRLRITGSSLRTVLLAILSAATSPAQFQSLATNYDGSHVYFVTTLAQRGTDQPRHGKLFVVDPSGLRQQLIRHRTESSRITNFYDLLGVSVPGDVSALGVTGLRECFYMTGLCGNTNNISTTVYDSQGNPREIDGAAILSPNGRWALVTEHRWISTDDTVFVLDRGNGARSRAATVQYNRDWRSHAIANDGTAVVTGLRQGRLALYRPPTGAVLLESNARSAAIGADGKTAVWVEDGLRPATDGIHTLDTHTLERRFLFRGAVESQYPSMSHDGRLLLFVSQDPRNLTPQAFVMNIEGGGMRQLTSEPGGVHTAVLSGNGAVAWVVTRQGSLLQVDVASGTKRQRIGRTPWVDDIPAPVAPGQVVRITGTALAPAGGAAPALRVDGRTAPVLKAALDYVEFQVPWETPTGATPVLHDLEADFEPGAEWELPSPRKLRVALAAPVIAALPAEFGWPTAGRQPYGLAAHQNFQSLVTPASPARPGEVIHLYATGLGATQPPVATGTAAPDSPSWVQTGFGCQFHVRDGNVRQVELLFAGLAPRTIGYYQVSLRLPEDARAGDLALNCASVSWVSTVIPVGDSPTPPAR